MPSFLEDPRPDFVNDGTVFELRDKYGHLADFMHAGSGRLEDRFQVSEDLLGLRARISSADEAAILVSCHLARHEYKVAHPHRMCIRICRRVVHCGRLNNL